MSDTSVHGAVDRATDSKAFEYTARAGFAVSGVLHLSLRLHHSAPGVRRTAATRTNPARSPTLAAQPGGAVMLWIAAVGTVALGLWHVAEAIVGSKPAESGRGTRIPR